MVSISGVLSIIASSVRLSVLKRLVSAQSRLPGRALVPSLAIIDRQEGARPMDFADSPEHAAFRSEVRRWLESNLPAEICVDDAADQRVAPDRETLAKRIRWQKTMQAAGWVGLSWPKEYGGRGASFMQQVIFDEEYTRARAPVLPGASGLNLLGPSLIHWGTGEQKQRHLPRILNAAGVGLGKALAPELNAGGDLA